MLQRQCRSLQTRTKTWTTVLQRMQSSDTQHSTRDNESELQHEASKVAEGATFFATGVKAAAHTLKEKTASAVGMSDKKPVSENESMEPAGHMQSRDPDASAQERYAALKEKSKQQWKKAGLDKEPHQQYPAHGRNY